MKILAIDSTAIVASSAVCEIENGAVGRYCLFTLKNGMTHSENLLPLVDGALTAGGYDLSAIDLIAVSAGPGSFTGVRIGVATVKGLAYSGDKPVCGVSTPDALYRNIAGMAEVICPVMDARRHQFYNAVFVNGVKVTPDRCAAFENIYAELKAIGKKVLLCGDGAPLFKSLCPDDGDIILPPVTCTDQNAVSVALCGYDAFINGKALKQNVLQPIYLRASQAERTLSERNNKDK